MELKLVITRTYTLSKGPEPENNLIFCLWAIVFGITANFAKSGQLGVTTLKMDGVKISYYKHIYT